MVVNATLFVNDLLSICADVGGMSGFLSAGSTYYLTLGGANNSLNNQLAGWDTNNGSSTCYFAIGGSPSGGCGLGGETFAIYSATAATPEPGSIVLFGSGALCLAGLWRRRLNR